MSDATGLLVENEAKRKACFVRANSAWQQLVAASRFDDEEGLGELDITRIDDLVLTLRARKEEMRALRAERRQIAAGRTGA